MRHGVAVTVRCPVPDASLVYATLTAFDELAVHTDVVRSVVQEVDGDRAVSHWDVSFRSGRLCWTEADHFDSDRLKVSFEAIAGDPLEFRGQWQVTTDGQSSSIAFEATLELGIGSFEAVLDPIAAQTVVENVAEILTALFSGAQVERLQVSQIAPAAGAAAS